MTDKTDFPAPPPEPRSRPLLAIALSLVAVIGCGMTAGMLVSHLDHGGGAPSVAFGVILLLVAGATLAAAVIALRLARTIVVSPRTKVGRAQWVMISSIAIGMSIALVLPLDDMEAMYRATDPVEPAGLAPTLFALVMLLVVTPLASLLWHRSADELDRASSGAAAVAAIYVYMLASMAWWVAWRGGLTGAPDPFAIFWAVLAVYWIVFLFRKYR